MEIATEFSEVNPAIQSTKIIYILRWLTSLRLVRKRRKNHIEAYILFIIKLQKVLADNEMKVIV